MGRNLHYFHARNIESVRMGNIADAYNMNGWASESTRTDVVDMYRNPTADASIIHHYTQPLYIAVKLRNKVVPVGFAPIADLYIINEKNLKGKHTLNITFTDAQGNVLLKKAYPVTIKGGEEFGQLLVEDVKLPALAGAGYYMLKATLDADGTKRADGFDDVYAVDIKTNTNIGGTCAVLESDNIVKDFLSKAKGINAAAYAAGGPDAASIIVGNYNFESISDATMQDIIKKVQNGTKLIVLENADKFAVMVNKVLKNRPMVYNGGGIIKWDGQGRLFVGRSAMLDGLPQAQGMSWEYQCFYKGPHMDDPAIVSGLRINNWGNELVVALGNQGAKEILTSLTRVPVGKGSVVLSTLQILPNLNSTELSAVVAKKLFLNLLK
jgi:hypothetical protein